MKIRIIISCLAIALSFSSSGQTPAKPIVTTPVITPTALSGDVNNYNPTGLAGAFTVRQDGGASARNITGLQAPVDQERVKRWVNIGANNQTLKNESSSSTAANRFSLPADIVLASKEAITLIYDSTSSRWRPWGWSASIGGSGPPSGAAGGDLAGTYPNPSVATGAITDAKASLSVKPSVNNVATSNLTLSGTQTIDGNASTANLTVTLCTAQTSGSQNGPWVQQTGAWTRPSWYASGSTTQAFNMMTVKVRNGTLNGGSDWKQTASGITIDTTATTWTQVPYVLNSNSVGGTLPAAQMPALTGDVTTSAGAVATTIATNAVTNAKAAQMATNTIKGNNTGSTANAIDLSVAQLMSMLSLSGTNTGDQLTFLTLKVSGQSDVVADTTSDTLFFANGTGIAITTNAGTDTLTVSLSGSINLASSGAGGVTGTLPVANGGTGLTALGSGLQVLRTNAGATALEFATLPNAAADGSTKGVGSFASNDFDASSGNISIDYVNGQAADATHKGFLTASDFNAFSAALQNFDLKNPVACATTGALPFSPTYSNGSSGVGATLSGSIGILVIDGYTPALGDRIGVKNQASTFQNGVYTVTTLGTVSVGYVLTRATDFNSSANIVYGDSFPVLNGTANANQQFTMNNNASITVGTTAITFAQTSGGSQLSSDASITITGNALSRAALTGEATASAGSNAVTLTNSAVIAKVLTGYASGAGTVGSGDTILQAVQKLNGNDALKQLADADLTVLSYGLRSLARDLAYVTADMVDTRLAGQTAGSTSQNIFSTRTDTSGGTYVRSTSSFIKDVDLTCVSVWNSEAGGSPANSLKTVTLIAPDVGIGAHHFKPTVGETFRFITNTNTIVPLVVGSTDQVGSTDIEVVKFTTSAAGTITPAKILPAYASAFLTGTAPGIYIDQTHKAFVGDFVAAAGFNQSSINNRNTFWKSGGLVSGDSSHPAFAVIDNQAVLAFAFESTLTGGPSVSTDIAGINMKMTSLGSSNQVTQFEFTPAGTSTRYNASLTPTSGMVPVVNSLNRIDDSLIIAGAADNVASMRKLGTAAQEAAAGDPDLAALAALSSTGFPVRTASNAWAQRSIAGTSPVSVTDGNGVAGNPTIAVAAATTSAAGIAELATDGENAANVVVQGNDSRFTTAWTYATAPLGAVFTYTVSSASAVDLKTVATTNLFTVPAGKIFKMIQASVIVNTASGVTHGGTFNFKTSTNSMTASSSTTTSANMNAAGREYNFALGGSNTGNFNQYYNAAAGETVQYDQTGAASATTLTGRPSVTGYYIAP